MLFQNLKKSKKNYSCQFNFFAVDMTAKCLSMREYQLEENIP